MSLGRGDFPLPDGSLASALGRPATGTGPDRFVDDEPRVFEGLRNLLHRRLSDHDLVWAASGEEALAEIRRRPIRAVVSDVCMPGISLLSAVRKEAPSVFRVILTGIEAAGAEAVAHRVLRKPCPAQTLGEVILQGGAP